jgi:nucleoside-diphosphate-sugar epimerase
MAVEDEIAYPDSLMLVTGATGFIGAKVIERLLFSGFHNIRCLVRPSGNPARLEEVIEKHSGQARAEIIRGDLLSRTDCARMTEGISVIYHLAAGTGTKAFSDAYLNSAVTTRNLLDAALEQGCLKRFVNISSFAVYTNRNKPKWRVLDESCPVEPDPGSRAEAYCFGKVKQDEIVVEYGEKRQLPYVILRPGNVFGPGKKVIPGRVGVDSFGIYMHLGGSNPVPLTYVDNCAEAIVLAGIVPGIEGEVFNIVDDDLPSCRRYLRLYKKNVRQFKSVYLPHAVSYLFCCAWEKYAKWSKGQLPPVFTRREWAATWKKTKYSNRKIKAMLGWSPRVPMDEALNRFFVSLK